VAQKRVDPQNDEEVAYENIVKGYELAPDRYVVIEPAELDTLQPKKTKTIEIEDFVELSQIDPIFYDHPYYLAPGPGGAKPYRLLLEAMHETGKVAIARVVIRSKEQLVAVRPMGIVMGMATMLFADEILPPERLEELPDPAEVKTSKRELEIAKQLVDSLAGDFEPDKYHDTYREEVLALIERKAQGEEISLQPPPEEVRAPAPDLMSALKASLDAVRAQGAEARSDGAAKRRKPAAKKAAAKKGAAKKPAGSRAASKR
jgi:DNA end-binding protein Ku